MTQHNLKRPCAHCPFRSDIRPFISACRVSDIEYSVIALQQDFPCHETVDYDGDGDSEGSGRVTPNSETCAGMMILCEKMERPTQMMRIDERLGFHDRRKLDMSSPVYDTFNHMYSHHHNTEVAEGRKNSERRSTNRGTVLAQQIRQAIDE